MIVALIFLTSAATLIDCDTVRDTIANDRCELNQSLALTPDAECKRRLTQFDMNVCSYRDYLRADIELNETWSTAMRFAKVDDAEKGRLLSSQRKWLAFREAQCLLVSGPREESGTIWAQQVNECNTALTRQRTKQLQKYIESFY